MTGARSMRRAPARAAIVLAACALGALAAHADTKRATRDVPKPRDLSLARIESRYATLVSRHRPDLAARYGIPPRAMRFVPLDEAGIDEHVRELRLLLQAADSLGPAEALPPEAGHRLDTLRTRVRNEIDESAPGGALRHDALLWLDIVEAAVQAPFASGSAAGCDRTRRATALLHLVPDALRSAAVLMRGAPPPDPASFEARLARLESVLRRDLPARTNACKEGRRLGEFAEADTLAAASLMEFRRSLVPGE